PTTITWTRCARSQWADTATGKLVCSDMASLCFVGSCRVGPSSPNTRRNTVARPRGGCPGRGRCPHRDRVRSTAIFPVDLEDPPQAQRGQKQRDEHVVA